MPRATATDADGNCPRCDGPVTGISTSAPGEFVLQPCGHVVGADVRLRAAGGGSA